MSDFTLSLYEKAMPSDISWPERLAAAQKAGFDALEISIDESEERLSRLYRIPEISAELRKASRSSGISIFTMCLSAHRKFPLGSTDPSLRKQSLDIMERAVDLAAESGIRIIQLAGYDVYYEPSTQKTKELFLEGLVQCVAMASKKGVILGFETMENDFMNTVSKAMIYVEKINSPYLQVYPDIGNISNGAPDIETDLKSGTGHLVAAHLKETAPGVFRDMKFGQGSVNFALAADILKSMGVRLYNAEFWHKDGEDWQTELKKANDFLRKYL